MALCYHFPRAWRNRFEVNNSSWDVNHKKRKPSQNFSILLEALEKKPLTSFHKMWNRILWRASSDSESDTGILNKNKFSTKIFFIDWKQDF